MIEIQLFQLKTKLYYILFKKIEFCSVQFKKQNCTSAQSCCNSVPKLSIHRSKSERQFRWKSRKTHQQTQTNHHKTVVTFRPLQNCKYPATVYTCLAKGEVISTWVWSLCDAGSRGRRSQRGKQSKLRFNVHPPPRDVMLAVVSQCGGGCDIFRPNRLQVHLLLQRKQLSSVESSSDPINVTTIPELPSVRERVRRSWICEWLQLPAFFRGAGGLWHGKVRNTFFLNIS